MSPIPKQIIAGILTVFILYTMYYGCYLPFRKSQLYIDTAINFKKEGVRSFESLVNLFEPAFKFYSPVGQDEIISNYLSSMINLISQQSNPMVIEALVKESERRADTFLKLGKGFNYSQSLYAMAMIYRVATLKLNDEFYYQKAIETFSKGIELSPTRSTFLYGLFDLYVAKKDLFKAKEIGRIVLEYWPADEEVKRILNNL